ncbi:hypothetical protein FRC06_001656 [Ceratobasidium sp. 370]|nr:hypothetical protein FRC06_001656 [Ceratobasidium sp. 370]
MSQTLSGLAGNERLRRLAALAGISEATFASVINDPAAEHSGAPEPKLPRAPPPPPSRASPPKPALPCTPSLTTPAPPRVDLRDYSQPGAPADVVTFTYLWHIQKLHGKTATWFNPPPEIRDIISSVNAYALMAWIKHLGGYDAFERNPHMWNQVASRLKLVKNEDQDDGRSRRVIEVIKRVERVWLRPFEQYCADWPEVSRLEKERLLYMLGRKIQELDPTVTPLPFSYDICSGEHSWPPVPLEPLDPRLATYVAVRLVELSEPGIPTDYATCFYLMKLWNLARDPNRPSEVPPLPQPKPGIDGKPEQLNYYTFYMAINELEGGLNELVQTAGAWNRLAFKLKLIDREGQDDAHSKQAVVQLRIYFKHYFCYFGMFCDKWVGLDKKSKDAAILILLKSLSPEDDQASEPKSEVDGTGEGSELGVSGLLKSAAPIPLQGNPRPVDLYAHNTPGIPQDDLTANYFVRLWLLETGALPPLPAWNGDRIKVDLRQMRTLIDGFGGPTAMRRFPELWREMAYELRLATREERGTERLKYVVESLQYVEQEQLLPFERFCTSWAGLAQEEKAKQIGRLAVFLKHAKSDLLLPMLKPGDGAQTIQVEALTAARVMEQKLGNFYPDEPFEERVKRLRTLTVEEAAKYGIGGWIAQYQQTPFSDEDVKTMAAVLAEQFFFLHAGSSVYIADVKDAQFARGVLRNEVQKTQLNYTLKAVGFQTSHGRFTG